MFDRKLGGRSKSTQLVEMRCQYSVMHFNAVNDIFRLCGRIVALVKGFFSVGAGRQKIAHMHLIYPPFFLSYNSHIYQKLGMSFLCEYAIATYFACCRIFCTFKQSVNFASLHIFLHKMAFLTAILILFLFPLPISIRFRYLYHLVATIFGVYVVHIFFKTRRIKLRCLHSSLGVLHSLASVIMLTAV